MASQPPCIQLSQLLPYSSATLHLYSTLDPLLLYWNWISLPEHVNVSSPTVFRNEQNHVGNFLQSSASKSNTISFVSSVPLRLPTAHTSLVLLQRTRHTTPPLPPLSRATKLRRKSPVRRSQILTVPSSDDVMTNFLLNCKHVTALWCLLAPEREVHIIY